jgi:glycine/D-amino acid oxidase-like deaminating enzyme
LKRSRWNKFPQFALHAMITKKRNLRSGQSYWESRRAKLSGVRTTPSHQIYDVIIVGAGITGALVAHALADLKLNMLVIDRRAPGAGSTSASTALIQWEIDEPLGQLAQKVGARKARASYLASFKAVQSLKRRILQSALPCDVRPRKTLLLAGTGMGAVALRNETKRRTRAGLPSRFLDADMLKKLYGFEREGAIESRGSLEIDPLKLTLAALSQVLGKGVEILSPVDVTQIESTGAGVFLTLSGGEVIASRKVIVTTGYEVLPEISKVKYKLISTWALATVPQAADGLWPDEALVWEASDPYLYFRTTKDRRIIVGGEDASFKDPARRDALTQKKVAAILKKLSRLLPNAKMQADFQWAGTFAESPTGLPVIGPVGDHGTVFAVLGAGGNGITYSEIAASLAKAWVQGRSHSLARLFAP